MIGIIDYGAGNIQSLKNAFDRLKIESFLSSDIAELEKADRLVLPGVGHASKAMQNLKEKELDSFLKAYQKPLLGICLGMQLMSSVSEEGETVCLNIFPEQVIKFKSNTLKIPKMGWNQIENNRSQLFDNIDSASYFYFVHSFYMPRCDETIASANYGIQYSAAIKTNNFFGVQFHPEKSGKAGLQLLKNFSEL